MNASIISAVGNIPPQSANQNNSVCNISNIASNTDYNQLYQGDCIQIMQSRPAGSVDLILTDPPYLVNDEKGVKHGHCHLVRNKT